MNDKLPSIIPKDLETRFAVRLQCLEIAKYLQNNNTGSSALAETLKYSKELEKYVWGGFGPIEAAPTPLSTIAEAGTATRNRVTELANNTDPEMKTKLWNALPIFERFMSEIHGALVEMG